MPTTFILSSLVVIKSLTHYAKGTLVKNQLLIFFEISGAFHSFFKVLFIFTHGTFHYRSVALFRLSKWAYSFQNGISRFSFLLIFFLYTSHYVYLNSNNNIWYINLACSKFAHHYFRNLWFISIFTCY